MTTQALQITPQFQPWPHQVKPLQARARGARWIVDIWHRRGGKDMTAYNGLYMSSQQRVGTYYHLFPELAQGRKVWWDGMDNEGRRLIEYMPKELWDGKPNETEMQIQMVNGSIYQVVGADRLGWIGSNPVGVTLSEYQRQDPKAWQYLTPILLANGGWAWFVYTPLGHNHGYDLYKNTKNDPAWHVDLKTVVDTCKPDGSRIVTDEMIEWERRQGKSEALIQQEYFCSFEGNLEGAVYGTLLAAAKRDKRVTLFNVERGVPVVTAWDLGMGDATAIGFYQQVRNEHRLIDYYEGTGHGLEHYAEILREKQRAFGYQYEYVDGNIVCEGPHDLRVRELGTGKSRAEIGRKYGLHFRIGKKLSLEDGIAAVRRLFPKLWIHETGAARVVEAAGSYAYEKDEVKGTYSDKPVHNWASHPMDQLRYYAVSIREDSSYRPATKAATAFDIWTEQDAAYEFNPLEVG